MVLKITRISNDCIGMDLNRNCFRNISMFDFVVIYRCCYGNLKDIDTYIVISNTISASFRICYSISNSTINKCRIGNNDIYISFKFP